MSHRESSSTPVRWIRPSLEVLEDRTLLSPLGDLVTQFGTAITGNVLVGETLVASVNLDSANFEHAPTINNFVQLYVDAVKLQQMASLVSTQVTVIRLGVSGGEKANLLTGPEAFVADATVSGLATVAAQLRDAAGQALADVGAAFFALLGHGPVNLPSIPTTGQLPTTQTNGTVSESINNAPQTAPQDGGVISQSVTVNNPSNSPVNVTVSYTASDGTSTSQSDSCTNSTVTVQDGAPPSVPGVVGTWTTTVTGLPTQTNTTTWTQ